MIVILLSLIWLNLSIAQTSKDSLQIIDYHVHVFSKELISNLTLQGYDFKNSNFQVKKEYSGYSNLSEIFGASKNNDGNYEVFGVVFSQYFKKVFLSTILSKLKFDSVFLSFVRARIIIIRIWSASNFRSSST